MRLRPCFVAGALAATFALDARGQPAPGATRQNPIPFTPDTGPLRVRKSINRLTPVEIARLQNVFATLKAANKGSTQNDIHSQIGQQDVHLTFCAGGVNEVHHTWLFLPWHRAYLHFFEKIAGAMIGDDTFALPYWDWRQKNQRRIPAPYLSGSLLDARNALVLPGGAGLSDEHVRVFLNASTDEFVGDASHGGGSGIESFAHDNVHDVVGSPNHDMRNPLVAALDPVFYAHHANIDRLWDDWSKTHQQPADPAWANTTWVFFGPDRKFHSISVRDVVKLLNLKTQYQPDPSAAVLAVRDPRAQQPAPPKQLVEGSRRAGAVPPPLVIAANGGSLKPAPTTFRATLPAAVKASLADPRLAHLIFFDGIDVPDGEPTTVRVFIGLPTATAATSTLDVHLAGAVGTLLRDSRVRQHLVGKVVGVPPAVKQQLAAGKELAVTMVPVDIVTGKPPRAIQYRFRKMTLVAKAESAVPPQPGADCPGAERISIEKFGRYQDGVASLPPDQRAALTALSARIAKSFEAGCAPLTVVELVGHADHDPSRTPAFERQISAQRAKAVRDAIAKAVGPKNAARIRFTVGGVGSADLKHAAPKTDAQRVENRRVIVTTRPGP